MNKVRKRVLIYGIAIIVLLLIDFLLPNSLLILKAFVELVYFGAAVVVFVNSILLIKRKDLTMGVTFLVLSSLVITMIIVAFIVGFIIGISTALNEPTLTGNIATLVS